MHPIQHQLHSDHYHIQLLLNCLSQEINCFDFDSQRSADMDIILSALDYFHVYPDKWHHPTEDVIFKRLLEKNIKEKKILEELINEHEKIALETAKVTQLFKTAADDCIVSAIELVGCAEKFISLQRVHLEKENEFIYPLLSEVFDAKEWKAIEAEIKIQDDPLFNKAARKEYDHLYQYIIASENEK